MEYNTKYPLHYACSEGDTKSVEKLITNTDPNSLDDKKNTPLHCLCKGFGAPGLVYGQTYGKSRTDILKLLVKKGALPNLKNIDGETPLICSCKNRTGIFGKGKYSEFVRALIDNGALVDETDNDYNTALFYMADESELNAAKVLIDSGAKLDRKNKSLETLLHRVPLTGTMLAKMLIDMGSPVDERDRRGRTPLFTACEIGDLELVKALVEKNASVTTRDNCGYSLLHSVGRRVFGLELLKFLTDSGAPVNAISADGDTPLNCAREDIEKIRILLDNGANLEYRNTNGETLLDSACSRGNKELVSFLTERGADVNAEGKFGYRPLHSACRLWSPDIAEILINKGANVNENSAGSSPLHIACRYESKLVIELLLKNKAIADLKNSLGSKPIDCLQVNSKISAEISVMLEEYTEGIKGAKYAKYEETTKKALAV